MVPGQKRASRKVAGASSQRAAARALICDMSGYEWCIVVVVLAAVIVVDAVTAARDVGLGESERVGDDGSPGAVTAAGFLVPALAAQIPPTVQQPLPPAARQPGQRTRSWTGDHSCAALRPSRRRLLGE